MNDSAKKTTLIIVLVAAVVLAAGSGYFFLMKGEEPTVARRLPPPPKGQLWGKAAMMAQDKAGAAGTGQAENAPKGRDGAGPAQGPG